MQNAVFIFFLTHICSMHFGFDISQDSNYNSYCPMAS